MGYFEPMGLDDRDPDGAGMPGDMRYDYERTRLRRSIEGRTRARLAARDELQVRVVHAEQNRGEVGTVVDAATQDGMDVVVRFASGHLAEFRWWELDRLGANPTDEGDLPC